MGSYQKTYCCQGPIWGSIEKLKAERFPANRLTRKFKVLRLLQFVIDGGNVELGYNSSLLQFANKHVIFFFFLVNRDS